MSEACGMRIAAVAAYAPKNAVSNARIAARLRLERIRHGRKQSSPLSPDEAKKFETSDRWIRRFIGFFERRFGCDGEGTIDLAFQASRLLLDGTDRSPSTIDWIVFGRVTPSYLYSPPDAALLQNMLGIPVWHSDKPREINGVDTSLACSTWVSSLALAYALIRSGMAHNILLIGADRMSEAINWRDRAFATVLGDAGTAMLCSAVPEDEDWFHPKQFWGWINGGHAEIINTPLGGSKYPLRTPEELTTYRNCLVMDGRAVKEIMVPFVGGPAIDAALHKAEWRIEDIDLATLHEANLRLNDDIVRAWRSKGFRGEVLSASGKFGNTTSASIPLAWALNAKTLAVGKRFGLFGFGGGISASFAFGTVKHHIEWHLNV